MPSRLPHDIHDPSVALALHRGEYGPDHREKAEHLVAQLLLQDRQGRALDGTAQMRAGVVDQDVDAAEGRERRVDEGADSDLVGDVGGNADDAPVAGQVADGGVQAFGVASANCDGTSFLQQGMRDRLADSA